MSDHHPHSRPGLYDEIDRLQAGLTALIKRFQEVAADRDEWKQQHENLLDVHRRDLAALAARLRTQSERTPIPAECSAMASSFTRWKNGEWRCETCGANRSDPKCKVTA